MSRAPLHPAFRVALVLFVLVLATGCGPSTREASIAVMVVAGAVVVLANAFAWLLWLSWRRVRPALRFRWLPIVLGGAILSGLGLIAAALPYEGAMSEYLGIAAFVVGTSYLTIFLLVLRICISARNWLLAAHAAAATLMFAPALPLSFAGSSEQELPDLLEWLWILPGYGGVVAGSLFALLLIEALIRWRRACRARSSSAVVDSDRI